MQGIFLIFNCQTPVDEEYLDANGNILWDKLDLM